MDQKGLAPRDLIPFIGSRNRVYEMLARKRPLTLAMVSRLHAGLGIPADLILFTAPARGGRMSRAASAPSSLLLR